MLLQGRRVCVSLHACGPQLRLRPGLVALLEEWSARVVALLDAERELRELVPFREPPQPMAEVRGCRLESECMRLPAGKRSSNPITPKILHCSTSRSFLSRLSHVECI